MQRYEIIAQLIKNKLQNNLGAEVGVWKGETTQYLLKRFKSLRIHCIDPYKVYTHYAIFHTLGEYSTQSAMNRLYGKTRSKLKKFGNRCIWSRKESIEGAKEVKDNSLDWVFLDANWGYNFVKDDIKAWLPKIRVGGILIGHRINSNKDSPLCVQRAVEKCFGEDYKVTEGRWYHIKKEDDMVKKKAAKKATMKVTKNHTAYKAPKAKLPQLIADCLKGLPKKEGVHIVKSEKSLGTTMGQFGVVFAEGLLENTKRSNGTMWDLIRITEYKGYVACVIEVGADKVENLQGVDYLKNRFLPKFGFDIKLLMQEGNTVYFVGQT